MLTPESKFIVLRWLLGRVKDRIIEAQHGRLSRALQRYVSFGRALSDTKHRLRSDWRAHQHNLYLALPWCRQARSRLRWSVRLTDLHAG